MAPPDARAVTLYPHWAHAVAWLGKRIENRSRPIPPALVGQRVAIHAGATLPAGWIEDLLNAAPVGRADSACFSIGYRLPRVSDGSVSRVAYSVEEDGVTEHPIATRAIVATAVLAGEYVLTVEERLRGELGHGWPAWYLPEYRHHWRLADVLTLAKPVPVRRGQLGLWRLDAATVDAVGAAGGWA